MWRRSTRVPMPVACRAVRVLAATLLLGLLATASAQADPGGAVFDVTDFGAVPNDGVSDHVAIVAAIAAAAATPDGGIIHLPCGTYTASPTFWEGAFRIQSGQDNIWVRGASASCVTLEIHPSTTGGVAMISICPDTGFFKCETQMPHPKNIWISGMRILDTNAAAHAGGEQSHGLVAKCQNCRFFDLIFEGIGDEAFDIKESTNVMVERSSCIGAGVTSGTLNAGICVNIQASTDVRISDISCTDSGPGGPGTIGTSWCVKLESFHATIPIQNVTIERVIARGWSARGIGVESTVSEANDIVIRDSWIETGVAGRYSILMDGLEQKTGVRIVSNRLRGSVKLSHVDDLILSSNQITPWIFRAIDVSGSAEVTISGNVIRGGRRECIYVASAEGLSISGNRCIETGGFGKPIIAIDGNFFERGPIAILDNHLEAKLNTGNGIHATGLNDSAVVIRGNTILNVRDRGIFGQGLIQGNHIQGTVNAGIEINGALADGTQILDNKIEDSGGGCILALGTDGVRIAGNRGRRCTGDAINISAANGNNNAHVAGNDVDGTIRADGVSSICATNRAGGHVFCGGIDSVVTGNVVPPGAVVDGSGIGSQKFGNIE